MCVGVCVLIARFKLGERGGGLLWGPAPPSERAGGDGHVCGEVGLGAP